MHGIAWECIKIISIGKCATKYRKTTRYYVQYAQKTYECL